MGNEERQLTTRFIDEQVPLDALLSGRDLMRPQGTGYIHVADTQVGVYSHGQPWQSTVMGFSTIDDTSFPQSMGFGWPELQSYSPTGEFRLFVSDRVYRSTWFQPTLMNLVQLQSMTYQASGYERRFQTGTRIVDELFRFLISALGSQAAPPSLAPLNEGGIQAEWHRGGIDVEILFSSDKEERGVYVRDKATGEESEFALDPTAFKDAVGDRLDLNR